MDIHDDLYFDRIFAILGRKLEEIGAPLPSVSIIAAEDSSPYRVLVSTLISLRTRDSVTLGSSLRLFSRFPDFQSLSKGSAEEIGELIRPAGFYRRKAVQLKRIAEIAAENGVSDTMDGLLALPGVGIKTASLVMNLSYGKDAICVDCHVHQIANRLGWVSSASPEETERKMREILPKRHWIPLNEMLVRYGQHVCLPLSPLCSQCPLEEECPKNGVSGHR